MTRHTITAALAALGMLAVPAAASAHGGDRDHDKLPDRWEKRHGLSVKVNSAHADPDRDELSNLGEYRARTNARDPDSDDDRIEDSDEDRDRDRLDNASELQARTNPRDADSDDDGRRDGREDSDRDGLRNAAEDTTGNHPRDADTDDDGVEDGDENAGRIASFDGTTLTIILASGQEVSGLITAETEIECETEDEHESEDEAEDDRPVIAASGDHDGDDSDSDEQDSDEQDRDEQDRDEVEADDDEGDEDDRCATTDLVAGTVVHEAELEIENGQAVFEEIELIK